MFDKTFVSEVTQALILAMIPVLIPVLISLAVSSWRKTKAEIQAMSPEIYNALIMTAKIAVQAAEQLAMAGVIQEKKRYAIDRVTILLEQQGIVMDVSAISAAIESAVLEEFNKYKLEAQK